MSFSNHSTTMQFLQLAQRQRALLDELQHRNQVHANKQEDQGAAAAVDASSPQQRKVLLTIFKSVLYNQKKLTSRRQSHEASTSNLCSEFNRAWKVREQALEKVRIQALKENDTEAYVEHLSSVKIASLLSIMEQTHKFMERVGASLESKATTSNTTTSDGTSRVAAVAATKEYSGAGSDEYQRFKAYVASTKDEYRLIHKKTVFVEQQPKTLRATLMPHQMVGLRFLASLHANGINGILADEMGVGKTLQTLSFLLHLKESLGQNGPHLVLAPLSIVREWRESVNDFLPSDFTVKEFGELQHPTDAAKYNVILLAVHRVRIVHHDLRRVPWHFVIVDEAHKAVSNPATLTASAIDTIPWKHRLVLTGTPLNSDIQELWSLLHFINPDVFAERTSFEEVFRRPFNHCSEDITLDAEERQLLVVRMHQVLRPFMLRRTKRDVDMTLRLTYHTILCPLSWIQQNVISQARSTGLIPSISNNGKQFGYAAVGKEKTIQSICNHPFMLPFYNLAMRYADTPTTDAKAAALKASGKFVVLDYILQRLRSIGRKAVVFSHWLDTIDLVEEYFLHRGWRENYVILTGASSDDERKESVRQFRDNTDVYIMLLSMKAGGCGLNLQVANIVIMLDRDYTTTNEDQAVARTFRIGQKETVRAISLLTKDPAEARVLEIADRKNKPREAIIEKGDYNVNTAAAAHESSSSDDEHEAGNDGEADVPAATSHSDPTAMIDLADLGVDGDGDAATANRCALIDSLLIPKVATNAEECQAIIQENKLLPEIPFLQEEDVPGAVTAALKKCEESHHRGTFDEDCGAGKRQLNAEAEEKHKYGEPPEAYFTKWLSRGLEISEVEDHYIAEMKELEKHRKAQINVDLGDVEVGRVSLVMRRSSGIGRKRPRADTDDDGDENSSDDDDDNDAAAHSQVQISSSLHRVSDDTPAATQYQASQEERQETKHDTPSRKLRASTSAATTTHISLASVMGMI